MSIAVEIAVQDLAGLEVAAHAGADRVELCTDLDRGGVTAPVELVEQAAARARELVAARDARAHFDVHVLIRSHAGADDFLGRPEEFTYSPEQIDLMAQQARDSVQAGAAGVVLGVLDARARVDVGALRTLRDAAIEAAQQEMRGLSLTFHRAVDTLPDRAARCAAVEMVVAESFHRVLSSGGAHCAVDGADDLAAMVRAADGLLDVCAGGGVRPADIAALVHSTGVGDVHLSARRRPGADPVPGVAPGSTDPAIATAAVDAAGAL